MRRRALFIVVLLTLNKAAYSADFHCRSGDTACLIAAIHAANSNNEDNTIFLEAGEYHLTEVNNSSDGANGLPSITGHMSILGAEGVGSTLRREESAPQFRIFHVAAQGSLYLSWVNLTGGEWPATGTAFIGGGAILNRGTLSINNSRIYENRAFGAGGAISSLGNLAVSQATVTTNRSFTSNANAGAIFSSGPVLVEDSVINDNRSEFSGGISTGTTAAILRSTFASNQSFAGGGGIDAAGATWIEASSIYRNRGGGAFPATTEDAGGIANSGTMTVVATTVAKNVGFSGAGGIIHSGRSLLLQNVTVVENTALQGVGGIGLWRNSSSGSPRLENTTLALNVDEQVRTLVQTRPSDCGSLHTSQQATSGTTALSPSFVSLGSNIVGSLAGCDVVLHSGDSLGDPFLGPFLQDTRAGSGHFPLLAESIAINQANTSVCTPTDQVGRKRLPHCDIGAIEFRPLSVVNANSLVTFGPRENTFRFFPGALSSCPSSIGVFVFSARLTNRSSRDLTNLIVQVAEIENGVVLENAERAPGGVGAYLTVSERKDPADAPDGRLSPDEFVDIPFTLCLPERAPFRFSVNVLEVSEIDE